MMAEWNETCPKCGGKMKFVRKGSLTPEDTATVKQIWNCKKCRRDGVYVEDELDNWDIRLVQEVDMPELDCPKCRRPVKLYENIEDYDRLDGATGGVVTFCKRCNMKHAQFQMEDGSLRVMQYASFKKNYRHPSGHHYSKRSAALAKASAKPGDAIQEMANADDDNGIEPGVSAEQFVEGIASGQVRHLRLSCIEPTEGWVVFWVSQQSHIISEFSMQDPERGQQFVVDGLGEIRSDVQPDIENTGGYVKLFVRGEDGNCDMLPVVCCKATFQKVCALVRAYNDFHKDRTTDSPLHVRSID